MKLKIKDKMKRILAIVLAGVLFFAGINFFPIGSKYFEVFASSTDSLDSDNVGKLTLNSTTSSKFTEIFETYMSNSECSSIQVDVEESASLEGNWPDIIKPVTFELNGYTLSLTDSAGTETLITVENGGTLTFTSTSGKAEITGDGGSGNYIISVNDGGVLTVDSNVEFGTSITEATESYSDERTYMCYTVYPQVAPGGTINIWGGSYQYQPGNGGDALQLKYKYGLCEEITTDDEDLATQIIRVCPDFIEDGVYIVPEWEVEAEPVCLIYADGAFPDGLATIKVPNSSTFFSSIQIKESDFSNVNIYNDSFSYVTAESGTVWVASSMELPENCSLEYAPENKEEDYLKAGSVLSFVPEDSYTVYCFTFQDDAYDSSDSSYIEHCEDGTKKITVPPFAITLSCQVSELSEATKEMYLLEELDSIECDGEQWYIPQKESLLRTLGGYIWLKCPETESEWTEDTWPGFASYNGKGLNLEFLMMNNDTSEEEYGRVYSLNLPCNIDASSPLVEINATTADGKAYDVTSNAVWTNQNVEVVVTAEDELTKVASANLSESPVEWVASDTNSTDGSGKQKYTFKFEDIECDTSVLVSVQDLGGWLTEKYVYLKIDKTAPVLKVIDTTLTDSEELELVSGAVYNNELILFAEDSNASDGASDTDSETVASGISSITIKNETSEIVYEGENLSETITIPQEETDVTYDITVTDVAGNATTYTGITVKKFIQKANLVLEETDVVYGSETQIPLTITNISENSICLTGEATVTGTSAENFDVTAINNLSSTSTSISAGSNLQTSITIPAGTNAGTYTAVLKVPYYFMDTSVATADNLDGMKKEQYVTLELNITVLQKFLNVTPIFSHEKVYDGTTNVTIDFVQVEGIVDGDAGKIAVEASASYNNANAGENKTIKLAYQLTGEAKENYKLSDDTITVYTDGKITKAAGTGSITVKDIYYGEELVSTLYSSTNDARAATVYYKKASEGDSSYSERKPSDVGNYTAKVVFDETENYLSASAETSFSITRLAPQQTMYSVSISPTEAGWYSESVVLTGADGYTLSETENGTYAVSLTVNSTTKDYGFYIKTPSGAITDRVNFGDCKIDKTAPVCGLNEGICIQNTWWGTLMEKVSFGHYVEEKQTVKIAAHDDESGISEIAYYVSTRALTADELKKISSWTKGNSFTLDVNKPGNCVIYAKITNGAGLVTWISSDGIVISDSDTEVIRITGSGRVKLSKGTAYQFGEGEWKVNGDPTTYNGGSTFYVTTDGEYNLIRE
ncbi:MAG: YDG domain-containing protein [Roseburia sp.]